jgi:hypothetical protein
VPVIGIVSIRTICSVFLITLQRVSNCIVSNKDVILEGEERFVGRPYFQSPHGILDPWQAEIQIPLKYFLPCAYMEQIIDLDEFRVSRCSS